jgi:hypothetical protein
LFGLPAADLFNVPVRGHDIADYLRWRGLLQRALTVTSARQQVMDKVLHLAADPLAHGATSWTVHNLVRLTAAEQHWLKLPPLRFAMARELLADVCVRMLRDSPTDPPWLRLQAVMVMALSEPSRLVGMLPQLIAATVDEPLLVNQMLLECHRLLSRPAIDSPVDFGEMRRSLIRSRGHLEKMRDSQDTDQFGPHLAVLKALLAVLETKTTPRPRDPQEAWDLLREDLVRYVETHSMEAAVIRVRDFVEDMVRDPASPERTDNALSDWDQCRTQLSTRALNNLPTLTDILDGDYVSDRLGKEEQQRLSAVANEGGLDQLQSVEDSLRDLIERPWAPFDQDWCDRRRCLLDMLNWWHRMFMASHLEDDNRALVVQLISSAPVDPQEHIDKRIHGPLVEQVVHGLGHAAGTRVFCPAALLDSVLGHVVDNVHHHALPGATQRIQVECRTRQDRYEIVVRNTGSKADSPPGQGLRSLNEKLSPFGASVTGHHESAGPWTFTTTITLIVWQGA